MTSGIMNYAEQYCAAADAEGSSVSAGATGTTASAAKAAVRDAIHAHSNALAGLAHDIHAHPELAFAEEYAAARITDVLSERGFAVQKGICGLPTAFVATIGNGPLHVAFCAEYDALPPTSIFAGLRPPEVARLWAAPEPKDPPLLHACGHNLIAGASVAAAVGLKGVAGAAGLKVSVFGTPAEELIGLKDPPAGHLAAGKVRLLQAGAFEGVQALLMIHPGQTPFSMIAPSKAGLRFQARFSRGALGHGKRALGPAEVRRLEETLRRALRSLGQAPYFCVVQPETRDAGARADLFYAGRSLEEVIGVRDAVRRCFEEAASLSGVTVDIIEYEPSAEMRQDPLLGAAYRSNWQALGRARERDERVQEEMCKVVPFGPRCFKRFVLGRMGEGLYLDRLPADVLWGSDLGNVSQFIPALQPFVGIGGMDAAHTMEFAAQADTSEAHRAMLDAGIALAWTAVDAALDPAIRGYLVAAAAKRNGSSRKLA